MPRPAPLIRSAPGVTTPPVVVVGGGIVGVLTALELRRAGATVTLLERGRIGEGASYGNAGLLVPGDPWPLARPAAVVEGLRALVGRSSALTVRWRAPGVVPWVGRFLLASRPGAALRTGRLVHALAAESLARYQELLPEPLGAACGLTRRGWLHVHRSPGSLAAGVRQARAAGRLGEAWRLLDGPALAREEPALTGPLAGAILYPGDQGLRSYPLVQACAAQAAAEGVCVRPGAAAWALRVRGGRVTGVVGDFGELQASHVVVAAGADSATLLRPLGVRLPILSGRGHSLTFTAADGVPSRPLHLVDSHLVVASALGSVRISGGMDLGIGEARLDPARLAAIWTECQRWLPGLRPAGPVEEWCGRRPVTPDGRPVIGPVRGAPNVLVASGHGMLGVTLAPITARLIARCLGEARPPVELGPFLPRGRAL